MKGSFLLHSILSKRMDNTSSTGSEDMFGYREIHGYISTIVCSIGVMLNIVNYLAWTRQSASVSDTLLASLGVTDGLALLSYLIFNVYFYHVSGPYVSVYHSEAGMKMVIICFHAYIIFHMLSNFLTVALAVIRYFHVCRRCAKTEICKMKITRFIMVSGVISVLLATLPFYFYYEVYDLADQSTNKTGFWIRKSNFADNHVHEYQVPILWVYGVVFKILPCALMIALSGYMVKSIREAKRKKDQMTTSSDISTTKKSSVEYNKTTLMLIIIVMIYVLSEIPIAISAFISGLQRAESHFFYFLLFSSVGEVMDLITILNATSNFFIYFTMCKKYRQNIKLLFQL